MPNSMPNAVVFFDEPTARKNFPVASTAEIAEIEATAIEADAPAAPAFVEKCTAIATAQANVAVIANPPTIAVATAIPTIASTRENIPRSPIPL